MTTSNARPNPAAKRRARQIAAVQSEDTPATAITADGAQSYIPPMSAFDEYIGRTLPGGIGFMQVFDHARDGQINVLIEGPTGSGKTSAVIAYAAKHGLPFYTISSSVGLEPSQLFGKFVPNPSYSPSSDEPQFVWVDGPVTAIVRSGQGVLLLNEMNFIPDRIATVLFSLLDRRREITLLDHKGEVVKAAPGLLIVGDMNPDYEGTRPLNKAFRNRFGIQLEWDYDANVERTLVRSQSLLDLAKKLRREQANGTYETPCSTNALIEFEKLRKSLGFEFAVANFVQHYQSNEREAVTLVFRSAETNLRSDYKRVDFDDELAQKKATGEIGDPTQSATWDATWGIDTDDLRWVYENGAPKTTVNTEPVF